MLVLSRKVGERLIINDNIKIVIIETKGESVKIGIEAPRSVSIYREELLEEIKKTNKQSLSADSIVSDLDFLSKLKPDTQLNNFSSKNINNVKQ